MLTRIGIKLIGLKFLILYLHSVLDTTITFEVSHTEGIDFVFSIVL